jgi:hypothetical protein
MPPNLARWLAVLGLAAPFALAACDRSSPASSDLLIDPIQVDSVDVLVQESSPPQASAHVRGVIGDGCSSLHSVEQERSGTTVVLTILRQRPANAMCIQIARLYDDTIRLEGTFPPGRYVLRVNGVETPFTTQ